MCGALIGMSEKKGDRCYHIDWKNKRCYYSSRRYYESNGYEIATPTFQVWYLPYKKGTKQWLSTKLQNGLCHVFQIVL